MKLWIDNLFVEEYYDKDLRHWYITINGKCIVQLPYKMTPQQINLFIKELEKDCFL